MMKKDKECLRSMIQRRIDNLPSTYEGLYIEGSRDAYDLVLQDINQLDDAKVLSQEWIDDNKVARIDNLRKMTTSDVVPVDNLENILVPKHEITFYQVHDKLREESILSEKSFDYYWNCINDNVEIDELRNLLVPKQELTMTKLETLVVPTDLGEWLQSREMGESGAYFSTIDALYHYWESVISSSTGSFITDNKKELIEVILGTRGYRIETPLYCALIKGHELLDSDRFYWIYDKYEESVFVSKLYSLHDNCLTEMSKSQWNELGINDSNADFVKVRD